MPRKKKDPEVEVNEMNTEADAATETAAPEPEMKEVPVAAEKEETVPEEKLDEPVPEEKETEPEVISGGEGQAEPEPEPSLDPEEKETAELKALAEELKLAEDILETEDDAADFAPQEEEEIPEDILDASAEDLEPVSDLEEEIDTPVVKSEKSLDPVIKTKKATTVRTTLKKVTEEEKEEKSEGEFIDELRTQQKDRVKGNPFSTRSFRGFNKTRIDSSTILYTSRSEMLKGEASTPEELATESLRRALDDRVATIFRGKITGTSKVTTQNGMVVYFFLVNSDCGVPGWKGRTIRIPLENYIAPLATPPEEKPEVFRPELETEEVIYSYMNSRVGSEVEFIPKSMDPENYESGFVIASRLPVLRRRRLKYWRGFARDKNTGEIVDLIREGTLIRAGIVAVVPTGVYCEVFGTEVFIPVTELSHRYILSVRDNFENGQSLLIRVSNIVRNDFGITFRASHSATYKDPAPSYMASYLPGDNVKGKIVYARINSEGKLFYLVNIDDKFEVGASPKGGLQITGNPGDMVEVQISSVDVDIDKNYGKMFGYVKHIIKKPDFGR